MCRLSSSPSLITIVRHSGAVENLMLQSSIVAPGAVCALRATCLTATLVILGCASAPTGPAVNGARAAAPQAVSQATPATPAAPAQPADGDAVPDVNLSGALLYQLMAAEAAAQNGDLGAAYAIYLKLARDTRDPRLARRATELALQGRALPQALESAKLWHELAPHATEASQTLAMLYANSSRFDESYVLFSEQLKVAPSPAEELARIQRALSRNQDRPGAFSLLERLAQPYLNNADVRLVLANGAHAAGLSDRAAQEARAALALAPDSERAALATAQFLQASDRPAALSVLEKFVERNPAAPDARLAYARLLIADKRFDDARRQFARLLQDNPGNPDLVYSMALLSLQGNLRADAKNYLERYLKLIGEPGNEAREPEPAYLYLAQIAEDEKQFPEALKWLRRIEGGDEYMTARVREAFVLAKMQRLDEARKLLRNVHAQSPEERTQLVLAEAQLLREARRYEDSYQLLTQALEKSPDNVALLYDTAMAAEKLNHLDVMEKRLRRIIELKPDYAHAYNALGYTFAERNVRLPEALQLIEKARELAPDDAFILDSLGWVHYRLGDLKLARENLERAYSARPDAEVAIHLAEVLWAIGDKNAARKLLREVRTQEPGNELLKSTLARLRITL
jgi:tetratricopeptide (TPR) repeat protein